MQRPELSTAARKNDSRLGWVLYAAAVFMAFPLSAGTLSLLTLTSVDPGLTRVGVAVAVIGSFLVVVWVPMIFIWRRDAFRPGRSFVGLSAVAAVAAFVALGTFVANRGINGG